MIEASISASANIPPGGMTPGVAEPGGDPRVGEVPEPAAVNAAW